MKTVHTRKITTSKVTVSGKVSDNLEVKPLKQGGWFIWKQR